MFLVHVLCAVFLSITAILARHGADEPECPKFYYEEKTLEKLVRLEHKVELQAQDLRKCEVTLKNALATIEDEKRKMTEMVEKLRVMMAETETDMTDKVSVLEQTFKEKLETHELSVRSSLANYKEPTVLFKAREVSRTDVKTGRVLVFTEHVVNFGDGYDITTGYFSAPVSGSYMFTSQLCSTDSDRAHVRLFANGAVVESTVHHGADTYGTCITFTGVAVLQKGQRAWVQGSYETTHALVLNPYRWNSFSGILINTV